MTMLVLPLIAENDHPNPSAKSVALRLQASLVGSIKRLAKEVDKKGLYSLEGKIEPATPGDPSESPLYWIDRDAEDIPENLSAADVVNLAEQYPGSGKFPKVKVFLDGFSISAYDSHANEATKIETYRVPLTALDDVEDEVIVL